MLCNQAYLSFSRTTKSSLHSDDETEHEEDDEVLLAKKLIGYLFNNSKY